MDNDIPLAGVIGDPISHSKSPLLHGHWLKRYEISGHYIPMRVKRENLSKVLKRLPEMGFKGVNITIPHKELALELADTVTDRAALIGAANTLTFSRSKSIQADNTDGVGFIANIRQKIPDWRPQDGAALILGAGGASRAVVSALLVEGTPRIMLANRTRARAETLRESMGARIELLDWTKLPIALSEASLVVNTTSLGMKGSAPFNLDMTRMRPGTIAVDLIYNPLHTDFLRQAERHDAIIVDGLGMLLHQAAPGFERWFGVTPEVDDTLRKAVLTG
ncbi:MAG: shikimate dehydrogenase [Pseudomonadota bacterium]